MAADLDQAYLMWAHEGLSDSSGHSEELSVAQMLDHGSISFGKYAVESLSWEKRSVFTHNRRQEELEKFKAPGLVAKKKAYFEEHYKRIRILKGLANNDPQTEVTLDYGADSSISSQTGEDEESAVQPEAPQETIHGECNVEMTKGQGKNFNSVLSITHCGSQSSVSHSDLSSKNSDVINLEKNSSDASQITHLVLHDAMLCTGHSAIKLEVHNLETNSSNVSQLTCTDFDPTMIDVDSSERSLGRMNLDNSCDVLQIENNVNDYSLYNTSQPNIHSAAMKTSLRNKTGSTYASEPDNSSQLTGKDLTGAEQCMSGFTPANDYKPDLVKTHAKKNKEKISNSKIKGSTIPTGKHVKPEHRTKLDPIKSHKTNHFYQMTIEKKGSIAISSKRMHIATMQNNKLCPFSSSKAKGERSNVTSPRPFTFSMEKGAREKRKSCGMKGRESEKLNPKRGMTITSSNQEHEVPLQNTSKKTVLSSLRRQNSEKNRHQEAPSRKPSLILDNSSKDRTKPRSVNLSKSDRTHSNSRSNSGVRVEIGVEKQAVGGVRMAGRPQGNSKPGTSSATRELTMEIKKKVPPRTSDLVVDWKRPRPEVKRWR